MPQVIFNISQGDLDKWKSVYSNEYAVYVAAMEEAEQEPVSENDYLRTAAANLIRAEYKRRKRKQLLEASDTPDNIDLI